MSSGYVSGGGNLLTISEAIDSAHAISGTDYTDIDFEFNQMGTVNVTRDSATGFWGFEITHVADNETLTTKLETWAPASTTGEVEEFVYTDGTKIGGATGAAPDILAINYGATHTESGKRKVTATIGKFQLDSGAYSEENGSMTKPSITIVGQKAKQAVAIPAAMFCATLVSDAAETTISANTGGKVVWYTAS